MSYYDYNTDPCPKCGGDTHQDCVDIGVGRIYGPRGCIECGWSEDFDYDIIDGKNPVYEKSGAIDKFGGYHPPGSSTALAYRLAENREAPLTVYRGVKNTDLFEEDI